MTSDIFNLPEIPEEQYYLIAYFDLLGTKDYLKENDVDKVFKHIYYQFLFAEKDLPNMKNMGLEKLKIKIFSDNFLFAYPISNHDDKEEVYEAYDRLGVALKPFLSWFTSQGILFRGAITLDKLSVNEVMVWGKGLIAVVDIEEKIAIYPRVIIAKDLLRIFDAFNVSEEEYELKFSCIKDTDGFVCYNFLNDVSDEVTKNFIDKAKAQIDQKIKAEESGQARDRILQKYYWFKNYVETAEDIFKIRFAYGV